MLLKRPESDPNWPNMYHVPGAVVTPTDLDSGLEGVINRIYTEKMPVKRIGAPVFAKNELCRVKRGVELAVVYAIEIETGAAENQFFDVSALPDNLIEGHGSFILEALEVLK